MVIDPWRWLNEVLPTPAIHMGPIDVVFIGIWLGLNVYVRLRPRARRWGCLPYLAVGLLFTCLVPNCSSYVEVQRVVAQNGHDDSFTLLYTLFRFPLYWALGVVQLLVMLWHDLRTHQADQEALIASFKPEG